MVSKPLLVISVGAKEIAPWIWLRCHTWFKLTNSTRQSKMRSLTTMTNRLNHSALPKSWPMHDWKRIPKVKNTSFMLKKRQNQPKPMRRSKAHAITHQWLPPSHKLEWTHHRWLLLSQEQWLTVREKVGPRRERMCNPLLVQELKQMVRVNILSSQVYNPQRNQFKPVLNNSKDQSSISNNRIVTAPTMIQLRTYIRAKMPLLKMVKTHTMTTIFESSKWDNSS